MAAAFLPEANPAGDPLEPPGFLGFWAHWDGAWYSEVATNGYGDRAPESTAFFPLYPLLIGLGVKLSGGPALWGVLISLVSTLLALYFLYGIAEKLFDERAAKHATLAMAFFPTAFFLNAVYSEALFLALTTGAFWAACVRRDLLLAGVLGAFAAATRNLGVLLLIPLTYEWWRNRSELGGRDSVSLALVLVGTAVHTAYLWLRFGDPLISARQQGEYWGRTPTSPLETAGNAWTAAVEGAGHWLDPTTLFLSSSATPALEASNALNLLFLVFLLVVVGVGFAVLPPGLSIYAFIVTLLPVLTPAPSFPLMSMPRFALGAFPIFLVLGFLLSKNKVGAVAWFAASIPLGVALTALFVTWRWVA
ncbi:MAG: glycosyltransferase family 39 protein [Rubrobacteraceae bacterium]